MTSNLDNTEEIKGDRNFWSPWVIFFFGIPFASLNWWRMGRKRKAIIFLCVSIVVEIFTSWLRQNHFYLIRTNLVPVKNEFYTLQFLVEVAFNLILSVIMAYDIRAFNKSEANSNAVNWKFIFLIILSSALVEVGLMASVDHFYRDTRYCRFPRLQDLLYDEVIYNTASLKSISVNRYDLKCGFAGFEYYESDLPGNAGDKITDSASYLFAGPAIDNSNSFLLLKQKIEIHEDQIPQSLVDSLVDGWQNSDENFEIKLETRYADHFRYSCQKIDRVCYIVLGYKNILSSLFVSPDGWSDSQFERMLQVLVSNIDERMYEYEINISNAVR